MFGFVKLTPLLYGDEDIFHKQITFIHATMNISNPVAGAIERVDFKFISTEEIRAISVKQVQNDNTFDSLMLPVPDGLYDTALGAWGDLP